ncbi:hypothetical protein BTA51_05535 [Hahella sp. CCB-MM4]|uniref:ABC transporter substrate-binding protein n=1 Tax=Hahella sp. (strain CCB-MM4) TaxID=1926491 RepID=UPI000B9C5FD6|nr:ABC transporter substrate-binding protein [Hahella sp. CCB-MM4]OZG74468.1 hypothetical protein BTA51_05535 [Hahella sp. CCB-MM4]
MEKNVVVGDRKSVLLNIYCLAIWLLVLSSGAQADTEIAIAVSKTPLSAPFYVAEQEGFFKAEGLQVNLRECLGGHRCMQDMLAREVDFATCSDMVITQQAALGKPFYVLSTFVTSADDSQFVVRRSSGITSPSDFIKKRIGYVRGSASHYFAEVFLLLGGANPESNTFVELQPEDMPNALYEGQVDAVAIWQPWSYLALQKSKQNAFVMDVIRPYTVTFNLTGSMALVDSNPQATVRLIRALVRAEQFILQNSDDVKRLVQQRTGMGENVLDAIWPGYHFHVSLTQQFLLTLQNEYYWLRQQDTEGKQFTRESLDFMDYIVAEPLRQLDVNRVQLVPALD